MGGALVWEEPPRGQSLVRKSPPMGGRFGGGSWEEAKVGGKVKIELGITRLWPGQKFNTRDCLLLFLFSPLVGKMPQPFSFLFKSHCIGPG